MHTLLILNPGHFHAALVLRERHPSLSDEIYVYSEPGPDLDRFLEIAESFNNRPVNPTRWQIYVQRGKDSIEKLIEEKKGDIAVLAGRNNTKMQNIDTLNRAGLAILADKPWVTTEEALPFLRSTMASDRPLAADIMTERHEIATLLQKEFLAEENVFGRIRIEDDGSPAVFKECVHHLYKIVNEKPLVRPTWYFDIDVQGEGLVDTTIHLVDMTQWMLFPGTPIDYEKDIELIQARRWATRVPLDKFVKITGNSQFPQSIREYVKDDILDYFCNGELIYRIKEVPVHLREIWYLEEPPGGRDTHRSLIKGTGSDIMIRQLPETGFKTELLVVPHENREPVEKAVQECLTKWSDRYPGLSAAPQKNALLIQIPDTLRTTHEQHFCRVRDAFIEHLDKGTEPPEHRAATIAKYTLLAKARTKALASPFERLQ
ncbi:MAG: oxidoreductase [Deltaproteobacteria bacterium]|jgi:predicted dehydrogenase|nr:oxidoreductase [Deltaproteobacteria bacterium]